MDELDFYPPKPDLKDRESSGSLSRTIFSMVLFVMTFLFIFSESINFIIIIVLVLLIHELGHFLLMKFFGYRNVRMLFVPLMGAFVNGSKSSYSQKESFLVVVAGPMPGILLGFIAVAISQNVDSTGLFQAGIIFLAMNIINLIPLDPLDGGQLFKLLVRNKNEFFIMIFSFISSLVMIVGGFLMQEYLILIFGFLMGFRVRALQKRYQMHKELSEENINFRTTYKLLSNKDFSKIKSIVLEHTPALAKYIEMTDSDEADALLASQVNSILVTPTTQDAGLFFRIAVIVSWILCLLSPLILYFMIDKSWLEYAFTNW